jgi:hypothetical protein
VLDVVFPESLVVLLVLVLFEVLSEANVFPESL